MSNETSTNWSLCTYNNKKKIQFWLTLHQTAAYLTTQRFKSCLTNIWKQIYQINKIPAISQVTRPRPWIHSGAPEWRAVQQLPWQQPSTRLPNQQLLVLHPWLPTKTWGVPSNLTHDATLHTWITNLMWMWCKRICQMNIAYFILSSSAFIVWTCSLPPARVPNRTKPSGTSASPCNMVAK